MLADMVHLTHCVRAMNLAKTCAGVLIAMLALLVCNWSNCQAQDRATAIIISRLAAQNSESPTAETAGAEDLASDLMAAEKFCAAPVREDLLLTTYDCVFPLSDFQFYCKSAGKITPLELWAADPWMNLAVLRSKAPAFAPIRIGETAASFEKGQAYLVPAELSVAFGSDRRVSVAARDFSLKATEDGAAQSVHEFGDLVGVESKRVLPPGTPLIDAEGSLRLIALGLSAPNQQTQSLCVAVDSACARSIAALIRGEPLAYGFLGLEPANVSELPGGPAQRGVYVRQVTEHSPAKLAGLREENRRTREVDIVTQINGANVESSQQLLSRVSRLPFGEKVLIAFTRGKPGERSSAMQVECTLGKRYANPARPAFSQKPKYCWRGVAVDHLTAIDDFAARARLVDPEGCVVITAVDQESAAWKAGLRAGMFLSHVGGARVKSEADFEQAAKALSGPAKLITTSRSDGLRMQPQTFELAP
jgi:serine protease Do